ncbi:hypothetical protein ZWY2020_021181 [Hordeum vulgare]|nr:hypothetical protein ZWY2020_021181 [Hordeum vulgare]
MVAYVGGARRDLSPEFVLEALNTKAGISQEWVSVISFRPEDFLVVFGREEHRNRVNTIPVFEHNGVRLFFCRWSRQAQERATRSSKRAGTASSGPTKPKPVENVLLKMLGQGPEDMVPDDAAVHELRALFDSPLREQHIRVIAVLFDKTVPPQQEMVAVESTTISVV